MNIKTLGIDIAKNIFFLHGVDENGNQLMKKSIKRNKLSEFIANLPVCLIAMEACAGSNYWGQKFSQMGHTVKLIAPQFVKPYVKSNKNDAKDAEAIAEAATRPSMRFVAIKTKEQQDIQCIHKIRAKMVKTRTSLVNQIRGLLHEYGIVIPQGIGNLLSKIPEILNDANSELTNFGKKLFFNLYVEIKNVDQKIKEYNEEIEEICNNNPVCNSLCKLPGVGALTATAIAALVGDVSVFKNGRELSAYLGLVPRQSSSGGKSKLLGISKRGDRYVRCLLIHGARSLLNKNNRSLPSRTKEWVEEIKIKRGNNKATVALANKNARLIWAVMSKGENFAW